MISLYAPSARPANEMGWLKINLPSVLFVCAALYTAAFAFLPSDIRLAAAGALGFMVLSAAMAECFARGTVNAIIMASGLALIILSSILAYSFQPSNNVTLLAYAGSLIKLVTAPAALIYFSLTRRRIPVAFVLIAFWLIIGAQLLSWATHGMTTHAGIPRPFPFTGGLDGFHSSAYALLTVIAGAMIMLRRRMTSRTLALLTLVPAVLFFLLFQVRTTWLMLLIFVAAAYLSRRPIKPSVYWISAALVIAGAVALLAIFESFPAIAAALNSLSSGRTVNYVERLGMFMNRSAFEFMFGSGAGSDLTFSSQWWWHTGMNSHSSFIHFAIETGLVGLVGIVLILAAAGGSLASWQLPVLLAVVAGSLISNGPLERPLICVMFAALMALESAGASRTAVARRSRSWRDGLPAARAARSRQTPSHEEQRM